MWDQWDDMNMAASTDEVDALKPDAREETVLVAVVPSLDDWGRVLREGWYRIPMKRVPRRIGADYLAFYHPKVFSELRWTVSYYAEIRRYALMKRRELLPEQADHPRADDLYVKIDLGPLQRLPQPIVSRKLRRVTFIQTTLPRLLQARELTELWVHEPRAARWERVRLLGEATPRAYWVTPQARYSLSTPGT